MKMKMYCGIKMVFSLLFFCCAQAQNKSDVLKSTTKNLISYLLKKDSLRIYSLVEDTNHVKHIKDRITDDFTLFKKITAKYGVPTIDKLKVTQGANGENVVSVIIMDKIDSSFNLRKCELLVFFYPDRFISKSEKILNYMIVETALRIPKKKLIHLD